MLKRVLHLSAILLLAIAMNNCANSITPPGGGPKDETPPTVIETIPANGSANFISNGIIIKFDEFVSLENIQQSALISPPMAKMPDFKIKGKSIQVKFNEELIPNTTYSVYFGDAIIDITEKNPLSNYIYIFSTGKFVDSLSVFGKVINAFDLEPVEGAYVGLYKDNNDTIEFDSLPYLIPPYYLSKTDKNGKFRFSGLSDDYFFAFGLNDKNSNFFFDQPVEEIAFLDSLIHPIFIPPISLDTINNDSTDIATLDTNSFKAERSFATDSLFFENNGIDLYMFTSKDTIQRLLKSVVPEKNKILFSFSQPANNVTFKQLKYHLSDSLIISEYSENLDTLRWYLNNPSIDSLELLIKEYGDTLGIAYLKLDPSKKAARVKVKDESKKEFLSWKSNISSNTMEPDGKLQITFNQPMIKFNNVDSSILVINTDTILNPEIIFVDSIRRTIEIPFKAEEETKYYISFPDSAFTSWNNVHSKEIEIRFKTLPISDYGFLTLKLFPHEKQNYIIQMLNEKEEILNEAYFANDTTITYNYLKPQSVQFKIIFDDNNNHKWDPGDLTKNLQPEKVEYFPKEVKIRANWEIEEEWKF